MTSVKKESLDERLERIRKKNEEIEKKHQEAERDRLLAKVQGALVEVKPSGDDWPKEHKYDKLDFTYDVPQEKVEAEKAAKLELQQRRQAKEGRGSRFTDIPPDPSSFLADEERDGIPEIKSEKKSIEKKEKKDKKQPGQGSQQAPNKGRAVTGRHKKFTKSASQNDFDLKLSPQTSVIENFNNLTVSVSKDGEYKSVRLSQTPLIGSGRVGPRQITKTQFQGVEPNPYQEQPPQPYHNNQQNADKDYFQRNQGPRKSDKRHDRPFNKDQRRSNNSNNNMNFRQKSSPQLMTNNTQKQSIQMANNPVSKQFSVQDRLKRIQSGGDVTNGASACANNNNKNFILNIIASNDVNNEDRHRATNA